MADQAHVNYTGKLVDKGQFLLTSYSLEREGRFRLFKELGKKCNGVHDDDEWNGDDDLGSFSFLLGLIVLFLFVLAAAYAVKWVWSQRSESMSGGEESALDILKKRYARGEIGREEFERVKRELE